VDITWYQYLLLGSGICFVLVGLDERLGRRRVARLLKLAPGEAEFLGAGTLLYFILFAVGDSFHEGVFAAVMICTFIVWGGLIRLAHRNRRIERHGANCKADGRVTGSDGAA